MHGMAQFYLIGAGPELQLYVSPVNWKPDNPPAPMSSPASFAGDLYERLGPYRTLGWAEATWPLNEDRIDEKTFMDDLYRAFDDRAQVILQRLDARQWDLLVGVIESTDRVQHMMWRLIDPAHPMYDKALAAKFGDSIERVYRRCDELRRRSRVARRTRHADPDRLGPWLPLVPPVGEPEHLAGAGRLHGDAGRSSRARRRSQDLFGGGTFWENVDWTRTRAYAMGLGQIYLNLKGREGHGIVCPPRTRRACRTTSPRGS